MTMTRTWLLPADTTAGLHARAHVAQVLAPGALLDDTQLVATELAANAVRHGLAPIELRVHVDIDAIEIAVTGTSADARVPQLRGSHATAAGGQGLRIVQACAQTWSWAKHGRRLTVTASLVEE